jgi:hypothetical protein
MSSEIEKLISSKDSKESVCKRESTRQKEITNPDFLKKKKRLIIKGAVPIRLFPKLKRDYKKELFQKRYES